MAEAISEQLKKRTAYRRAMKSQCENAMNAGAKGVKIMCGGRLGGAEIARSETQKLGSIPLQTLDANVDYGVATARTTYGAVGIKVWIYKGKFGEEIVPVMRPKRPRGGPRRGGPGGGKPGGGGSSRSGGPATGRGRAAAAAKRTAPGEPKVKKSPKAAAGPAVEKAPVNKKDEKPAKN